MIRLSVLDQSPVPEGSTGPDALRNTLDNVCVIAGPGLGALLLLVADPWVALLANAATFVASALLLSLVRERSTPVDVTEGGETGPLKQMLVGITTIAQSRSTAVLVGFSIVATFVFGTDTVNSGFWPAIRTSIDEGANSALISLAASDSAWIRARRVDDSIAEPRRSAT